MLFHGQSPRFVEKVNCPEIKEALEEDAVISVYATGQLNSSMRNQRSDILD